MKKQQYVAGFLFNEEFDRVALVRKERPTWQKGFFNGIGGHVEDYEVDMPMKAMIREFFEETGVQVDSWERFCVLEGYDWTVHFYWATGDMSKLKSTTDEKISVHYLSELDELNVIANLRWLVPMAADFARSQQFETSVINYKS